MIPTEAVEAAVPWITNFLERRGLVLRGKEAEVLAGYVLEAAGTHLMATAFAEGHESGFWNGRLSHGDPEALTGIEHEKASNPYRKP